MLPLKHISIHGFKSIQDLTDFPLAPGLNVLIGPNGSGKSNFIGFFRLLREMFAGRLQYWTAKSGGADRIVSFGMKVTPALSATLVGSNNDTYSFILTSDDEGRFLVHEHFSALEQNPQDHTHSPKIDGNQEATLIRAIPSPLNGKDKPPQLRLYHFHDTTSTAAVKLPSYLHDAEYLREDAGNLAAYLYRIRNCSPKLYERIRQTVEMAVPFFDDFFLDPILLSSGDKQVRLLWRQKDSEYIFSPNQLSDGSLRFICLATALLQPDPVDLVLIDEPELGLHPHAVTLLGALLQQAALRMQIIVATQSASLVDEIELENLIIVERDNGKAKFMRLDLHDFQEWLSEYSLGELWKKNVLGGRFP